MVAGLILFSGNFIILQMPKSFAIRPLLHIALGIVLCAAFLPVTVFAQETKEQPSQKKPKRVSKELYKVESEPADSIRRWEFGLNFGAYFPNKYTANFYNGSPGNVNNVNYVMSNTYWYRDIKYALGSADTVLIDGYPMNMHYQVSFMGGLFLRFHIDRKNSLFLQADYTRMKAADVITLEVDPKTYLALPDIRTEPIIGKEGRVMINLGYQRTFPLPSRLNLFLQAAFTMCYTQVIKSVMVIESTEYSLINIYGNQYYVPNSNIQTQNINQNAFGFGAFLGGGLGIPLTDRFGIEPGFYSQYYPVNLQGYPDFKISWGAYLRLMINLSKSTEE